MVTSIILGFCGGAAGALIGMYIVRRDRRHDEQQQKQNVLAGVQQNKLATNRMVLTGRCDKCGRRGGFYHAPDCVGEP